MFLNVKLNLNFSILHFGSEDSLLTERQKHRNPERQYDRMTERQTKREKDEITNRWKEKKSE